MARLGLLTFSDGRDFAYAHTREFSEQAERRVVAALRARGHEVVHGCAPVGSNEMAVREARAVAAQRGSTFGRIGGRPMGMYTAVSNTDQWMRTFGVDVEEID